MANSKVTALNANTTPALTDVMLLVDDPGGTPASQKLVLSYLDALFRATNLAFVSTANGTAANTTDATSIIGTGSGSLTLAAAHFSAGKTIRLKAYGVVTNTGTPTLEIIFLLGAAVVTTGAITTESGLSNTGWECEVYVTCRTAGASGTVFAQGALWIGANRYPLVNTTTDTVDTTGTLAVGLTATWGAADASNSIASTNVVVEKLN